MRRVDMHPARKHMVVKDMLHCVLHEGIRDFYRWFYEGEEDYTVFTNAKYPQFLQNDPENRRLIPIE